MALRRKVIAACLMAAVLLGGCGKSMEKSAHEEPLVAGTAKEFGDLPVPIGFRLEKAYSFDVPPSRMFLLEYRGKSDMARAKQFYKEEMLRQNWVLTCESTYGKTVFLDFEKSGERCTVKLEDERSKVRVTFRSHK